MILKKVQKKKIWKYEYENKKEMENHLDIMQKAGFAIEELNKKSLTIVFSQTMSELKDEDIKFEKKREKIYLK